MNQDFAHINRNFLEVLFGKCFKQHQGFFEYRLIRNKGEVKQRFYASLDEALGDSVLSELRALNEQGWNIFFGASPRMRKSGEKADIAHVATFWADLDGKDYPGGKAEALEKLLNFEITPTAIVDSGHGYHGYWVLSEVVVVSDPKQLEGCMLGIERVLGSDSVHNLDRVMRLPGFVNMKYLNEPLPCVLLEEYFHPELYYELDDFKRYWVDPGSQTRAITLGDIPNEVPSRFEKLLESDRKLSATWHGTRKLPNDSSRSGYDMSLAQQLKQHNFSNEEIAAVLLQSPSGKGQEATPQYLALTIGKARVSEIEADTFEERLKKYEAMVDSIPVDISKVLLVDKLTPLFRALTSENPACVRGVLEALVKSRFNSSSRGKIVTQKDVDTYTRTVSSMRAGSYGDLQKRDEPTSQAARLIQLTEENDVELFHGDLQEPYARVKINGHLELQPLSSQSFKRYLSKLFWDNEKKAIGGDAIKNVLNILEAKALHEGTEYKLWNRVAWHEGAIWYDLSDKEYRAVRITENGWEIIDQPPILFQRYSHHKPQVSPAKGGDLYQFLDFFRTPDQGTTLLLLVATITNFIPDIPHVVLMVHGSHGAAKTTSLRFVKRVIDPSKVETIGPMQDEKEFAQVLSHNYFVALDNLSTMSASLSDVLARAVTGSAGFKRMLYTTDDDFIYEFKRCIGLNGINIVAKKPDLLQRSIHIALERIPDNERKEESALWTEFEKALPSILGGMFDILVVAMKKKANIQLKSNFRMADFVAWGCAITEALGLDKQEFINAYKENLGTQNEEIIAEEPVAMAVIAFVREVSSWQGTATELLDLLALRAGRDPGNRHWNNWPSQPNKLAEKLTELAPTLATAGVCVKKIGKRTYLVELIKAEGDTDDQDDHFSPLLEPGATSTAMNVVANEDIDATPVAVDGHSFLETSPNQSSLSSSADQNDQV